MKKILIFMLLLVFAVSLTSCKKELPPTEGLKYKSSNGVNYVAGIGDAIKEKDIVIPEISGGKTVTGIAAGAFKDCTKIETITISKTIKEIDVTAFYDCKNLHTITVKEGNPNFKSIDGNLYTADGRTLLFYSKGKTNSVYTVPYGVTTIESGAFNECVNLAEVKLPSVQKINNRAFEGCKSIENVEFGSNLVFIGDYAFAGCTALSSINIPDHVSVIGSNAFFNCEAATSLTIGKNVTSIGTAAFAHNVSLQRIVINAADINSFNQDNQVFLDAGVQSHGIEVVFGATVEKIPSYLFANAEEDLPKISKVTFEDTASLKSIGKSAFKFANSINEVEFVSLSEWKNVQFADASADPLKFANTLLIDGEAIAPGTFENYTNIKTVVIGETLETIGADAFKNCSNIEKITLGSKVLNISHTAFLGCNSLNYTTSGNALYLGTSKSAYHALIAAAKNDATTYTIHSKTQTIADRAFYGCYEITSIAIPDSVIAIGNSAFEECVNLNGVYIDSISKWCSISFGNAYANPLACAANLYLEQKIYTILEIPKAITEIKPYAFYNCESIVKVSIHKDLESISNSAFESCEKLVEVCNLSELKIEAGSNANGYVGSYALNVYSDKANTRISKTNDGFIFYEENGLYYLMGYEGSASSIELPKNYCNTTYAIYHDAFIKNSAITEVTIPDNSVASIGSNAFANCVKLTSIKFGEGLTSIDSNAFANCVKLTSIKFGEGLTSIGSNAFANCVELTSVKFGKNLTSIGDYAFQNCNKLKKATIPNSVTEIGAYAFIDCTELTDVTISNKLKLIREGMFNNCTELTNVKIGTSVISIEKEAFANCTALKSITIPDSVQTIKESVFSNCVSLQSIVLPDSIISVGEYAFSKCTNLTSVTLSNNMRSIQSHTFSDCVNLEGVTIPENVISIGKCAFSNCLKLAEITISNAVERIYSYAFDNCTGLTTVIISGGATSIGEYAFSGCTSLESVSIINGVTNIENDAFSNCTNLKEVHTSSIAGWCAISFDNEKANPLYYAKDLYLNDQLVTELVIPDTITEINNYSFYNCESITSVTMPKSINKVSTYAFYNCTELQKVCINDVAKWCTVEFETNYANPLYYAHNLYLNNELVTNLVIPGNVMTIEKYAFYNCSSITAVSISNSVESVKKDAFSGCTDINEVHINSISSWCNIVFDDKSDNPLYYAKNLYLEGELEGELVTELVIPENVTSINKYAFYNCESIVSVTIPESITSIAASAFYNCTKLEKVTINNIGAWCDITFIDSYSNPLYYAKALYLDEELVTKLIIPDTVKTINNYVFYNCESITSVVMPKSITSITEYAFYNCTNIEKVHITDIEKWCNISFSGKVANPLYYAKNLYLEGELVTELVIPDGVEKINAYAFYNCESITSVVIPTSVTVIGADSFSDCTALVSVYYCGTQKEWKLVTDANKINVKNVYFYSEEQPEEDEEEKINYWHYDEEGTIVIW